MVQMKVSLDDEAKIRALRTRALLNDDQLAMGFISREEHQLTLADIDAKLKELEDKYGLGSGNEEVHGS
jgi:hypothetical protein